MFTYTISKETDEIWKLYEEGFMPSEYKKMRKNYKQRGKFFSIAKDGEKVVGAMAVYKDGDIHLFVRAVTHKDYLQKMIATSVRYMIIKHCIEDGASKVGFVKVENLLSHSRFKAVGFKRIGSHRDYTYYETPVSDLKIKKLKKIWNMIETGKQGELISLK